MKVDYWQSVRPIVNRVLPREYREDYLDGLDENPNTGIKFAREAVVTVASTWASNAVAAFNRWGYLVESALAMFCLFRSTLPWSAACAHAAIMITLICRDAYTFHFVEPNRPQSWKKYHVDSTVDGVVAGVVLLGSQMLWLKFAPSLALPAAVLFRGAVVGLPLISAARAALRPKPDPKLPFDANFDDADAVYKRVWWLNVLWLFAFYALMLENASDKPGNPMDFVRGWMFYPLVVWNVLQSDMLSRKCTIETLFMNHQVNKLRRMQAWLAQGMKKGQPLYGW